VSNANQHEGMKDACGSVSRRQMTDSTTAKRISDRDLDCIWHPCSQMTDYATFPPLPVSRAEGCRLHLDDGRIVFDAISSWWCKSLGHAHPAVMAAIRAQTQRFDHVILANTTNDVVVELAERLLALVNGGQPWFTKVFFTDNGSSGIEAALKMALHAQHLWGQPQRTGYAVLAGGYHGETVGALAVSDLGLYADPYRPLLFPALRLTQVPWRNGPEDPAWMDASAEWPALERQLASQADTLAAIIYEPVLQGAGGKRPVSPDLLARLRRWTDAHGVLLIADEIAAGLGRCGAMLASHLGGTLPDIAVLSKGLTGGSLPLCAVLATQRLYDTFLGTWASRRAFLHSHTYSGNALACAAANAALRVLVDENLCQRADALGRRLRAHLGVRPGRTAARGIGLVAAVDLVGRDPAARTGWRVYQEAVRRGCLLRPLGDTLYLFPPLNTAWEDLEQMAAILDDAIAATA
jgi:adenosylmethionine-8-amino-7-oxononanoate aminotransferase